MACLSSNLFELDELVPAQASPPSAAGPRGAAVVQVRLVLDRVPLWAWIVPIGLVLPFSLPIALFLAVMITVYQVLNRLVPANDALVCPHRQEQRKRFRHYRPPAELPVLEQEALWAEAETMRRLSELSDGFIVLHDLHLPTAQGPVRVDFVVISPYGLWCLQANHWSGRLYGGPGEAWWVQVQLREDLEVTRTRLGNPLPHNDWRSQQVRRLLPEGAQAVPVRPLVVFTAAELWTDPAPEMISLAFLTDAIRERCEGDPVLSQEQVLEVAWKLRAHLAQAPDPTGSDPHLQAVC